MIHVEAETLRDSSDKLLDNLKEGVVILDEDSGNVRFLNKAAKDYKIKMNGNFSMQLIDDEEEIDRSQK